MSCNFEGANIVGAEKVLAIEAKYIIQDVLSGQASHGESVQMVLQGFNLLQGGL